MTIFSSAASVFNGLLLMQSTLLAMLALRIESIK